MDHPLKYRTVFISDLHLGSAACKEEAITDFLHAVECEKLYLVGDIIDTWVMTARKWQQVHTNIVRTVLGIAKKGTTIYYTPGNHDSFLRKLIRAELGNVVIDHQFVHETADGKRYLVVHGDFFDKSVNGVKFLAHAGAWTYEGIARLHNWREKVFGPRSPDKARFSLKARFKGFLEYFTNFEEKIVVDAANQGYDGVICGHIHKPKIVPHESGATYINTGDWMENLSAVVEHFDGRLELVFWDPNRRKLHSADELVAEAAGVRR